MQKLLRTIVIWTWVKFATGSGIHLTSPRIVQSPIAYTQVRPLNIPPFSASVNIFSKKLVLPTLAYQPVAPILAPAPLVPAPSPIVPAPPVAPFGLPFPVTSGAPIVPQIAPPVVQFSPSIPSPIHPVPHHFLTRSSPFDVTIPSPGVHPPATEPLPPYWR